MKLLKISLCLVALIATPIAYSKTKQHTPNTRQSKHIYNVMFYNVENFFDTTDDPNTKDDDFTPSGMKHWTKSHLYDKNKKIGKVITTAGGWDLPVLVGLCEVEGDTIGHMLTHYSPIKDLGYKYLHQESQDRRGIDVMLLYREELYSPISTHFFPVETPNDPGFRSRDILYSKGALGKDTLHVFVNHWPSKYGGVMATIPLRKAAALTLKKRTDSIMNRQPMAKIIIMGDLNDAAHEPSIMEALEAGKYQKAVKDKSLVNLSWPLIEQGIGSHKYHGHWDIIDHMIVSKGLLEGNGLHTTPNGMQVLDFDFLLEDDERYMGRQPHRTYIGMKYHGGYSDHLPVLLQLQK